MIKNIAPYISVPAGLIGIFNFFFTILPVDSVPNWWIQISHVQSNPHLKIFLFILLSFSCCLLSAKLLYKITIIDFLSSYKITIQAIIICFFAWMIVYDVKFVMFSNSLIGDQKVWFIVISAVFYHFSNYILNTDLDEKGYITTEETSMFFGSTPLRLAVLRTLFFWGVVIIGGYFYNIPNY